MLINPCSQIGGHAGIEHTARFVGHDVGPSAPRHAVRLRIADRDASLRWHDVCNIARTLERSPKFPLSYIPPDMPHPSSPARAPKATAAWGRIGRCGVIRGKVGNPQPTRIVATGCLSGATRAGHGDETPVERRARLSGRYATSMVHASGAPRAPPVSRRKLATPQEPARAMHIQRAALDAPRQDAPADPFPHFRETAFARHAIQQPPSPPHTRPSRPTSSPPGKGPATDAP